MPATLRKLIVGLEDLLGVIALGLALMGAVTTWWPPPEAAGGPRALGYVLTAVFLSASVLFLLAARHVQQTGRFSPLRHAAPILCALLAPLSGFLSTHL